MIDTADPVDQLSLPRNVLTLRKREEGQKCSIFGHLDEENYVTRV
jgi:hypothetical protein